MKNVEVAQAIVENALAYLESNDIETVKSNLKLIGELLEDPDAENQEWDWSDFQ
jgi:hypothetical protein